MQLTLLTSLKIIFMYGAMKEGNILFLLRQLFDRLLQPLPLKMQLYLAKPLYNCLFCMSSIWGIIFTYWCFEFSVDYLFLLLQIAGINYMVSTIIHWFHDQAEKDIFTHHKIEQKEDAATKNIS